jgi:hypothetical protein
MSGGSAVLFPTDHPPRHDDLDPGRSKLLAPTRLHDLDREALIDHPGMSVDGHSHGDGYGHLIMVGCDEPSAGGGEAEPHRVRRGAR